MSGFSSGLGFVILVLALLFTWLAVAAFVSPELAAFMGLAVIAMWAFFFLPMGFIREVIWQGRQKKIMQAALAQSPSDYQPGSALPPPSYGGALSVIEPKSSGGAVDVYREMPQLLPQLEPRDHAKGFKRALVLPVVGLLMFIGANNDTFLHLVLESRGLANKPNISWDALTLPPEFADKKEEMQEAARKTIRREQGCNSIISGSLTAKAQFSPPGEQLEKGDYVYEFVCLPKLASPLPYSTWIDPQNMTRGTASSIRHAFSRPLKPEIAAEACQKAAIEGLKPLHASLQYEFKPEAVYGGKMPYPDYLRLVGTVNLLRSGQPSGTIRLSCWVGRDQIAEVRFFRIN